MTAAQPYRGRHSAPEPHEIDNAPVGLSAAARSPIFSAPDDTAAARALRLAPKPVFGAPPEPELRPGAPWAAPTAAPTSVHEIAAPDADQEWIAYTPSVPQEPPVWEVPDGFVPFGPPPSRPTGLRNVAIILVVALVGALGWLGYRAVSHHTSTPTADAQPPVPAATVTYTSTTAHFTVRLPATPQIITQTTNVNGYTLKMSLASDEAHEQVAGGVAFTPDLPSTAVPVMLRSVISGMDARTDVSDVVDGTYEGHPSVTATADTPSGPLRVLAFTYSPSRLYILVAGSAASLDALERNFTPTP